MDTQAFIRRIEQLNAALQTQWQAGYESALHDLNIDPESHDQLTRNPW